jgi:hypothetical protein
MKIKDYSLLFKKGRSEYDNQMDRLKSEGRHMVNIQATVSEATKSIESGGKAFVIYIVNREYRIES